MKKLIANKYTTVQPINSHALSMHLYQGEAFEYNPSDFEALTKKTIVIRLPGIKAVSRNQTAGHWHKYKNQLQLAETWMMAFGKRYEHHFENLVDVHITAYYKTQGNNKVADSPNIDDKIFTDVLIRYKQRLRGKAVERPVWFIEDDNPNYLRYVTKESIPSDHYEVVITIKEVE